MRLLVTGGCGFIGSNFVRFILEHYQPEFVTNVDVLTYAGNPDNLIGIAGKLRRTLRVLPKRHRRSRSDGRNSGRHKFYAVVNFAAESHVDRSISDPGNFIHTNVIGTEVLLEAARKHGVKRFLQVSQMRSMARSAEGRFTESSPLDPSSPYSASKASADLLALAAFKTFGQEVVITRCSNNYGPYQFPEEADTTHDYERARGQETSRLWGWIERAGLDSCGGPLPSSHGGAVGGPPRRDLQYRCGR